LTDTELLCRLIAEGHRTLHHDLDARRQRIVAGAGALSGTYEPGYLDTLPGGMTGLLILDAAVLGAYLDVRDLHHPAALTVLGWPRSAP
jgi:hypothetical protein